MPKFGTKNANFGLFLTKNALFGYLWGRILKNYCDLKSAPSKFSVCKISRKNKNA